MLRPIENRFREIKSLNGLWRFAFDSDPGLTSRPWLTTLPGLLECPVPASYNDIFVPNIRSHVGKVWYQREIVIPRSFDRRVVLRVDSATHEGEVYLNEHFITRHVGGYMPFEADFTKYVQPGDTVRVTIGVANVLTNETVPPGKVITNDLGQKELKYYHDFFNYSGLHRNVRLCSIPKSFVKDVTVKTDIEGTTGIVNYEVEVHSKGDVDVEVELKDQQGKAVGTGKGAKGTIKIRDATFWDVRKAYLYTFTAKVTDSAPIDEYSLSIGIRTVKVHGLELLINDKPVYLKGFGRHEDVPVKGKGHDDSWMVHDFELMKWTGANSFRTSHYPYAEEVYDYADKQGFLIIDEVPAVGINLNLQGSLFGAPRVPTFCPEFANDKTQAAHKHVVYETIQRDKNHPSVIMWSITNEPDSADPGSKAFFEPTCKLAREMDDRPLTYASVQFAPADKDHIAELFDVISLNRYYGWYTETGNLALAEKQLEYHLLAFQHKFDRPLLITEYGADTVQGLRSLDAHPWSEDFQTQYYDMYHRVFDRVRSVIGEQVWNFADFQTEAGIIRVDGNKKGIFTRVRQPKQAAYTLKERWTNKTSK